MNILSATRVRSLAGQGFRLAMFPRDWVIRRTIAHVGGPYGRRFAQILDRLERRDTDGEHSAIAAIERQRAQLRSRDDVLADGTLGEPGPYDSGLTVRDACRASKPPRACLLMHLLVREFAPRQIVELGTNLGVSAAYQACALKANGAGRICTLEASPYRLRVAKELHAAVGLNNVD